MTDSADRGASVMDDKLLACVHCGFCLPACPTYQVLGDEADSPRGRLHLMRAVAEGRLSVSDSSYQLHLDRCLGCRACEPVCPADVPYAELLEHARAEIREVREPGLLMRGLLRAFGGADAGRRAAWWGRLLRSTGVPGLVARIAPRVKRLHPLRLGAAMLQASVPWRRLQGAGGGRDGATGSGKAGTPAAAPEAATATEADARAGATREGAAPRVRVGTLAGCVQKGLYGRVGEATVRVLGVNGFQVVGVRDAGCCGALHAHAGELEAAREAARRQIAAFEAAGVEWVVADAAGCGAAMKAYGELLADDSSWAARARDFSNRVRDVTELLAQAGPHAGGAMALRAAYDPPCHLVHGQRVHDPVLQVLASIPELEVVEVPGGDRCCGGAGIYGLSQPELGRSIAEDKVAAVRQTGADVVLTGNPGCMMQIGAGLLVEGSDMGVVHPVEMLDESYRRGGFYA